MKRSRKIALVLLSVVALIFGIAFFVKDKSKRAVIATRRELRAQGFKTDLEDFDFAPTREMRSRSPRIMRAMISITVAESPQLKEEAVNTACAALFSGPIAFDYYSGNHGASYQMHALQLQSLAHILAARALRDLRNGDRDGVWFNVIALSRIATAWEPGPGEAAYAMRCDFVKSASRVICQALNAGGWRDEQLVDLQTEWASVDFFKNIPDAVAFTGATMIWHCQSQRTNTSAGKVRLTDILASPKIAWTQFRARSQAAKPRAEGSYEEEKELLLFFRDRQIELRRALKQPTWAELRTHTRNTLARAAEAETWRRLLLTATALERQRLRKQSYPKTIADLSPSKSPVPAIDFMDGQPLRYRLHDDGTFLLYSVGWDCIDNGGIRNRGDIVWSP